MKRFQIERADFHGDYDSCIGGDFATYDEAVRMAMHWVRRDPNCCYGVRVVDTEFPLSVVWQSGCN